MSRVPMSLVAKFRVALKQVAKLSEFGNTKKYSPDSWRNHETRAEALAFIE